MSTRKVLPPAVSGRYIAENSDHVTIHNEGLESLCDEILKEIKENGLKIPDTGADVIHPSKEHPHAVDWIFVCDVLNFCFWSFKDTEKWMVQGHTGYYALEAALYRAIEEGYNITNPAFYSKVSAEQLHVIMRGDTKAEIPLFDKRIEVLHEAGKVLLEKYNGTFETCVKEANKSAIKLLNIIVDNFPCFRDEAIYKGTMVSLYKRAQILVADLWNFLDGTNWGEFKDIDEITMFADYRVPQVLVYFGAISYTDELMNKLKNDVLLPSGSQEEVEIRGCSIHAVELLKKHLQGKIKDVGQKVPNSSLIDYYLWCYRRKYADALESIPFHKTLGIFY